jgi:RNA polymerase sigma factor (sigma-70 family)
MQEEGLQTIDLSIDIEAAVEEQEMTRDLYKALMELLPQQRELIQKIFYEGMSIAQIARDDGVSESAIRDRINRIYKKLKKYLT